MKGKHIHIAKDTALLKLISKQIQEELLLEKKQFIIKITLKFMFYFVLTILCYSGLYLVENPFAFVACFILYGFVSLLFAFNFGHDLSHNTVFESKKLNHFCFILVYTCMGAHAEAWKQRHVNSHHHAPNVKDYDSDLKISSLIRVIPNSNYHWYHRYQHLYAPFAYTSYSLFWIFVKDFVLLFSKDEYTKSKNFKYHLSFWFQKLFYVSFILVFPLFFSSQKWQFVLLGFLLMHLLQSLFLLFTFFMTHHVEKTLYPQTDGNGYIMTSWLQNQVKSSNDMYPFSDVANFIFGGFNNHIAHHLFPQYHHIYYPKLNRILYSILLEHGIKPNQTSYWGGLVSHLKLLKRMSYP